MSWKFEPRDFANENSAADSADDANRKLKEWIEAAPMVYGDPTLIENSSQYREAFSLTQTSWDTHTARLICIEPIKKDTADAFMRDWLACCDAYASQVYEGPFQKFVDRARKLLGDK